MSMIGADMLDEIAEPFGGAGGRRAAEAVIERLTPPPSVSVTPDGYGVGETWRPVAGATGGRVTSASITVHPDGAAPNRSLGVAVGARSSATDIVVDAGAAPLRAVRIPDLVRVDGEDEFRIDGGRSLTGSFHLIVTPSGAGDAAPVAAAPPLPRRNQLPAQLVGARLGGSLLTLPDLVGGRFTIRLVDGDAPDDMAVKTFHHGDVTIYAPPMPVGVHIDDPTGAEVYALAGLLTSPVTYDLTAAVNRHVGAVAAEGTPIQVGATVRSDLVGRASVVWAVQGGVIERSVDGRLSAEIDGASGEVLLPPPHPGRSPRTTRADVTVTHHGMAIHPLSDPVPAVDAGVGGPAVRDQAVVRKLPPNALDGHVLRRVAVIGWPRGDTDLTLSVLGTTATASGLAGPARRAAPSTIWFDVGELAVDGPVELALIVTRGSFGWVADPEPLVRLAVATTPNGERVSVGGVRVDLAGAETLIRGASLSGTDRWTVATDQFCTVTLSNLVMEFAP